MVTRMNLLSQITQEFGFLAAQTEERIVHPLYGLLTWVLMLGGIGAIILGIGYLCGIVNEIEVLERRKSDPDIKIEQIRREKRKKGAIHVVIGVACVIIQNIM